MKLQEARNLVFGEALPEKEKSNIFNLKKHFEPHNLMPPSHSNDSPNAQANLEQKDKNQQPELKFSLPTGIDNMIRKMEKIELAMFDWNRGHKRYDPVQ